MNKTDLFAWPKVPQAADEWAIRHMPDQRATASYVAHLMSLLFGLSYPSFSPSSRLHAELGLNDTEPEEFELALREIGVAFSVVEFTRCETISDLILSVAQATTSRLDKGKRNQ